MFSLITPSHFSTFYLSETSFLPLGFRCSMPLLWMPTEADWTMIGSKATLCWWAFKITGHQIVQVLFLVVVAMALATLAFDTASHEVELSCLGFGDRGSAQGVATYLRRILMLATRAAARFLSSLLYLAGAFRGRETGMLMFWCEQAGVLLLDAKDLTKHICGLPSGMADRNGWGSVACRFLKFWLSLQQLLLLDGDCPSVMEHLERLVTYERLFVPPLCLTLGLYPWACASWGEAAHYFLGNFCGSKKGVWYILVTADLSTPVLEVLESFCEA